MARLKQFLKNITILRKFVRYVKKILKINSSPYKPIIKRLIEKDKQNVLERSELAPLHATLERLKVAQCSEWNSFVYCDGYYYQGYERIGISGIKPTEERFKRYQIDKYLTSEKSVLDIGSNSGFLACYVSDFVKDVDGIELNPYLVEMGEETARFLGIKNVKFLKEDFISCQLQKQYDIVFSLSNHFTIDGNLNMDFESYIKKISDTLKAGGMLFFESHDIDGDDKDMDEKFKVAGKYFELLDYKMVAAFYSADIDKLFAIFRKLGEDEQVESSKFNLQEARKIYHY